MARGLIQIKKNFDFFKLIDKFPKIMSDGGRRVTRSAAKGARERIDKGLSPPLRKSTLELRKARGLGGTKPLYATGELYRSIKSTDEGLEMLHYGLYHENGFTAQNVPIGFEKGKPKFIRGKKIRKRVPARHFIAPSKKEILEPMKKLYMDIKKALTTPLREVHRG